MSAYRNALQRFDANGPVPFLQDGVLLDNVTIDFCILVNDLELLAPICHLLLPEGAVIQLGWASLNPPDLGGTSILQAGVPEKLKCPHFEHKFGGVQAGPTQL